MGSKQTRIMDNLGRLTIPKEIRERFNIIKSQTYMEIWTQGDTVVLKKFTPKDSCCLCHEYNQNIIIFKNKMVCKKCVKDIIKRLEW